MSTAKAHTAFHESFEDFAMVSLDDRVTRAAVGVNQDRIGAVKRADVARPAIGIDNRRNARPTIQTFLEQEAASPKFMSSGSMAWLTGNKDDFFISGVDRNHSTVG